MKSLLHLVRYTFGLDSPQSQVSVRELQMMLRYARNARTVCEIGCYEGRTSVALALNTTGSVYSVDPFFTGRLGICYSECVARLHRWRSGANNVTFLRGLSHEIAPKFKLPIDFLFIDADHSYEAMKSDWNNWSTKVTEGGLIALHDCRTSANSPHPLGSMRFYSEDIPLYHEVAELDSVDSLVILQVRRSHSLDCPSSSVKAL